MPTPEIIQELFWCYAALCATVKHLRAQLERGALCEECDQWEYNEDGSVRTFTVCGACWNVLQSQLEQLRAERDELLERLTVDSTKEEIDAIALAGIREGIRLRERNAINDFRSRAIQLCKDKAAKWKAQVNKGLVGLTAGKYVGKAEAANELAAELEKL